jgi:hypothetical protein
VPPSFQRELAAGLDAQTFDVQADHMAAATHPAEFHAALIAALSSVVNA